MAPLSPNAHNLNLSPDGKFAFMSPNGKVMSIADTSTHKTVKTIPFNDNIRVFVLNHDASLIYTNQNNFLGFQIADVKTRQSAPHGGSPGFPWRERWNATPRPRIPHGCPSHGIALTNDEKEVWLADGINDYIHIFDNTVMPPRQIAEHQDDRRSVLDHGRPGRQTGLCLLGRHHRHEVAQDHRPDEGRVRPDRCTARSCWT